MSPYPDDMNDDNYETIKENINKVLNETGKFLKVCIQNLDRCFYCFGIHSFGLRLTIKGQF